MNAKTGTALPAWHARATGMRLSGRRTPRERPAARGQALVESLLIVVLLTAVLFAALSFCIMVIHDMLSYEAAFSAARVAAVTPGGRNETDRRSQLAAAALLARHVSATGFVPCEVKTADEYLEGCRYRSRGRAVRQTAELHYLCRFLFAGFISSFGSAPAFPGARNMKRRETGVSLIKSPDEGYYRKAYHGAQDF